MDKKNIGFYETIQRAICEYMKGVYTAIPAHVVAFDPKTQMAQIELGVMRVDIDGVSSVPPPVIDVPVLFVGDGYVVETQIDVGCEGLALFSQRCIDGWLNIGGCAPNPLARFHDMTDALFIPGFRPMPRVISGFSNNGIKLRNAKGNQFAWLKNDGSISIENGKGHIRLSSDGVVTINGVTISVDSIVTAQKVVGKQDVTFAGISGKSHVHGGVERGNSTTNAPQ